MRRAGRMGWAPKMKVLKMRRAAPANRKRPFTWSAAGSAAHEAFIAGSKLSNNAPRCGLPTPLLNHETSVTSFRAVEAKVAALAAQKGCPDGQPFLDPNVVHCALHNKSCIPFFWRQNRGLGRGESGPGNAIGEALAAILDHAAHFRPTRRIKRSFARHF